jgi:hypothetical protein
VQTVALSWQHSGELAAAAAAVGGLAALSSRPRVRAAGAFLREAAVIGVLYGLWQLAGRLSGLSTDDAYRRARWIAGFERDVALPSEHGVQQLILGHPLVVQTANLYYATMHFTMLFVFLLWLFVRHRDRYRRVRSVLALTTLCCLLVQLIPVAPPRMLPGIVDTAVLYNQSVYRNGLAVDQLSAMPSVHVAWAVFVGYYAWRVSLSRWRYLGWAHAAITVFVVVATGNHWWLDGIVAVLLLVLCAWLVAAVRRAWFTGTSWLRAQRMPAESLAPPLAEPAQH